MNILARFEMTPLVEYVNLKMVVGFYGMSIKSIFSVMGIVGNLIDVFL